MQIPVQKPNINPSQISRNKRKVVPGVERATLKDLLPVAVEEDEIVPHQIDEDLPDQLAHVHSGYHLFENLFSWKKIVTIKSRFVQDSYRVWHRLRLMKQDDYF